MRQTLMAQAIPLIGVLLLQTCSAAKAYDVSKQQIAYAAPVMSLTVEQLRVRANQLYQAGNYAEAAQMREQLCSGSTVLPIDHAGLGECYSRLGRHQDAVKAFGRAVVQDPVTSSYRFRLAECLMATGDRSAAARCCQDGIAMSNNEYFRTRFKNLLATTREAPVPAPLVRQLAPTEHSN